jgi:hypothetical protein
VVVQSVAVTVRYERRQVRENLIRIIEAITVRVGRSRCEGE